MNHRTPSRHFNTAGTHTGTRQECSVRVLRCLSAADGYLDLSMPAHALAELDRIGDPGPLEAPVAFLRGEALKAQQKYSEAIEPLQRAARLIPAPHNQIAWRALEECFRLRGDDALADIVQMFAESSGDPSDLEIELQISIEIDLNSLDCGQDDSEGSSDDDPC
ncbi:MAG: hypothetical protein KDA79_18635 [Planctomycetaceae bacterium]|nr:hypothetical protein [Planctomycetaceae bacterium]